MNEGLDVERDFARKELLRELKILFLDFEREAATERRRKVSRALDVLAALDRLAGGAHPAGAEPVRAVSAEPPEPRMPVKTPPMGTPMPPIEDEEPSDLPARWDGDPRFAAADAARAKADAEERRAHADAVADAGEDEDGPFVEEGEGGDDTDEIPTGTRPDVRAENGAGLPAPVPGEGGRRRRRRGGRRRRRQEGEAAGAAAPGAGAPPDAGAAVPHAAPVIARGPLAPVLHPEVGAIQILGGDPPIPAPHPGDQRPVVRPGDGATARVAALDSGELPLVPEITGEVPLPADLVGAVPSRPTVPDAGRREAPRLDDVKAALERLSAPVTDADGVGPKFGELFAQMNISTIEDLLFDLPRGYQDRSRVRKISEITPGHTETVLGTVKSRGMVRFGLRPGFELIVEDGTGEVRAKWFHVHRGIESRFPVGAKVVFAGKFELFKGKLETVHPEIEVLEENEGAEAFARVTPVYALTEGISQKQRRKIQQGAVEKYSKDIPPATPYWARQKRQFVAPLDAIRRVNEPEADDDVGSLIERTSRWHKSLAYDELFSLQVGLALKRRAAARDRAQPLKVVHGLIAKLAAFLPYPLTDAQEKVLAEIKRDLMHPRPMHRLLQGDVGSGKTIVALMAGLVAIENRCQVALMAPTEILAEQHFLFARGTVERLGVRVALLTGSVKKPERDEVLKKIAHGEIDLVVGTHALVQEGVQFKNLALAIIDEQHRFGVMQRAALRQKGGGKNNDKVPHVLIMTATPIPRTLALTEFGDLDLSVIDRMPPGRTPVETRVCGEEERSTVWAQVRSDVSAGRQAFVVFPVVEANEEVASATEGQKRLQRDVFPEFRVGLLHGQMTREEKEGTMTRFKNGAIDILAATTVVEVGIDVPNATVMVVEHADRFGLAQLHQLRGRVGRGAAKSRAFFMVGKDAADEARERLGVLER
ncbi:MAG TPA: ATP-dependent DNA helicase RecG, partial [bacterium]|nr:ATP-dependent DNA helicase RecG [bacterium]